MLFLNQMSNDHKFNFANKDTEAKEKKCKKEISTSCEIPPPFFKTTFADSLLKSLDLVKEPNINADELSLNQISTEMLSKYGPYFSQTFDKKSVELPPENFISRHKIKSYMRAQLINWMLEVFHVYGSDENTFFGAVRILDKFIWKSNFILNDKLLFNYCITSIYLSSKIYDYSPIKMKDLIHYITHDKLDTKMIQKFEKIMTSTLDFDLISSGPSEFIQFLLYDLYMNNKGIIAKFRLKKIIDIVENCAIWIAKMCTHYEKYSSQPPNHIAVACLLIGYEMTKDNKKLDCNEKQFFVDWLEFLFEKIGKNPDVKKSIDKLYKDMYETFIKFKKSGYKNLMKYHELYFE